MSVGDKATVDVLIEHVIDKRVLHHVTPNSNLA